jgi:hypothetical protein
VSLALEPLSALVFAGAIDPDQSIDCSGPHKWMSWIGYMHMSIDETPETDWLRAWRDEYLTLEEIGQREGVSGEAIRRRLVRAGMAPRSNAETLELRRAKVLAEKGETIRSLFLLHRDIEAVAQAAEVQVPWVRTALEESVPDYRVLARAPRAVAKRYSQEDLHGSLRVAAASVSGILSASAYADFVSSHPLLEDGRARPSGQAMALRYGSWRGAMDAAKLPSNPHAGPDRSYEEAEAVSAVVDCWRDTGLPPTAARYDRWQQGRSSYPSTTTVRKRAGSWNELLVRAWQLVHGIVLDQSDVTISVPEVMLERNGEGDETSLFVPYIAADDGVSVSLPVYLSSGYMSRERGVQSHAAIQNAVAEVAAEHGLSRWSPAGRRPEFDVVLMDDSGTAYVVEVKSATSGNIEHQMRMALGQVLRYSHEVQKVTSRVRSIIAVELAPDAAWSELLDGLGIGLLVQRTLAADLDRFLSANKATPLE